MFYFKTWIIGGEPSGFFVNGTKSLVLFVPSNEKLTPVSCPVGRDKEKLIFPDDQWHQQI